jgi:hypothetical protein
MNKHKSNIRFAGSLCRTGAQPPMWFHIRSEYCDMLPGGPLDAPASGPLAGGCMWYGDRVLFNIVCLDGRVV